jgi:hypothetical protein
MFTSMSLPDHVIDFVWLPEDPLAADVGSPTDLLMR